MLLPKRWGDLGDAALIAERGVKILGRWQKIKPKNGTYRTYGTYGTYI